MDAAETERPEIDCVPSGDSRHSSNFHHSLGKGEKIEQSLAKIRRQMGELFHFTLFAFLTNGCKLRQQLHLVFYIFYRFIEFDGVSSFVMKAFMKSKVMFDSQSKACLPFSVRKTVVLHI